MDQATSGEQKGQDIMVLVRKVKPNVCYLATLLAGIEIILSVLLFILVFRVTGEHTEPTVLEAAGVAALFAAWLLLLGTIIGGLVSTMSQVAEDQKEPPPQGTVPADVHERTVAKAARAE